MEPVIGTTLTQEQIDQRELDNFFNVHGLIGSKSICIDEVRNAGRFFAEMLYRLVPKCADRTAAIRKIREAVWTVFFAIASDADEDRWTMSEIYDPKTQLATVPETLKRDSYDLLHDWIEENMKGEIGKSDVKSGETAMQFALRIMMQYQTNKSAQEAMKHHVGGPGK